MAHRIGLELCKKILKDEYEFVLSTHIDKGHIHNHIIFNNVNMVTGKCYQSNKKPQACPAVTVPAIQPARRRAATVRE